MLTTQLRTIKVAAGTGDNVWLMLRLLGAKEKFHFQIPDGFPQRGKQIFDLLPQVSASSEYVPGLSYKILKQNNIQRQKPYWKDIDDKEFFLCCNRWLELGYRLEQFLPDLPVNYTLPYQIHVGAKDRAHYLLREEGRKYIGIYTSAYSSQRSWGFWTEKKWFELIKMLFAVDGHFTFVLVGADWDTDLLSKLDALLAEARIPYINTVGHSLDVVIEMMRRFSYAFYFPSGLPIISETAGGSDCVMFMPPHLQRMIGSYAHPDRIKSGGFKECLFCEPDKIFKWVKDEYCLFDKI